MDVLINSHNMGHIEGIQEILRGASIKYVADLVFDSIVYQWDVNIVHEPKTTNKRKYRLSDRHREYVQKYAVSKHISNTIAANLILHGYFNNCPCGISADVTKFSPASKTPQRESSKPLHGKALIENLKR